MTTTPETGTEGIMAVRTFPPFTAREYAAMAADQADTARKLAEQGNVADAAIWEQWSEQTASQAEALAASAVHDTGHWLTSHPVSGCSLARCGQQPPWAPLQPLTTEEWDGD